MAARRLGISRRSRFLDGVRRLGTRRSAFIGVRTELSCDAHSGTAGNKCGFWSARYANVSPRSIQPDLDRPASTVRKRLEGCLGDRL